jgi:hypothetical protein
MEDKLKELIGQSNVWLYIESSKGWVKNAEILEVVNKTVTFRYEHESESEKRTWEKTTRIKNISEIEVKLLSLPKEDTQVTALKGRLSNLLGQD